MVRVPTYASYMSLLNQTMNTKSMLDLYSYQSNTGIKSPTYAGFGMSAYSIVSLEASLKVTSNFMENNKILNTELETMNTAMESVSKSVSDFKSMLNSFSGMDLESLTPDYTGGEISFTSNDDVYLGKTLTLDGIQYTFADNGNGNNIDISGLTPGSDTYAQDVMDALKDKVGATNPDFKFEDNKFSFPLYTVNGSSSVLNSEGVKTGEPHTMSQDQYQSLQQLQRQAFATMLQLADSLNVSANGKYLFGGGEASEAPVSFPFTTLEEFQQYYDGMNIKYPTNSAANLTSRETTAENTGSLTIQKTEGNQGTITAEKTGGFLTEVLTSNAENAGTLTFNQDANTINATQYGAFNTLKAGDTLVLGNTGANNGAYVIKSISADGKTITLEDSTPLKADETAGDGVKFSTSYPIGSVIEMDGFDKNIATQVQVTGFSDDGTTLYITADPNRLPETATTVQASSKWSMSSESYYKGGNLTSERRISNNQSITMDITANNPAFEKLFRALGQIAQGNVVDTRNPADDFDGLINDQNPVDIVDEAVKLIQDAVYSGGNTTGELNPDLYTVTAKISSNAVLLKTSDSNLKLVENNLENSVSDLKNVDQTEAAVKALMALNNLNASYQMLNSILNTSLLNYLK